MSYLSALHHVCCAAAHTDMTRPISSAQAGNVTQDTLVVFAQNGVERCTISHDLKTAVFKSLNGSREADRLRHSSLLSAACVNI